MTAHSIHLHTYAFLALPLSFLGLPLYMHLPKFYHDHYNTSLAVIGVILFVSRLLDGVIDSLLGVISDRFNFTRKKYFIFFGIGLAVSFNAFFYVPQTDSSTTTLFWFALCTIVSYFFYSLLFINYYNLGLTLTTTSSQRFDLSSFRELFSFAGILLAAVLPALMSLFYQDEIISFRIYGAIFAAFMLIGIFLIPTSNVAPNIDDKQNSFDLKKILSVCAHIPMRFILLLFFINSLPVAITSNLFNFYVDNVLGMHGQEASLLLIYFCAAALGAISITHFFKSPNKLKLLQQMMIASASSFSLCCFLNHDNSCLFYVVCVISGFSLGGELVILPALSADIVSSENAYSNTFFGIWASCSKVSLAVASGIFLPLVSFSDKFMITISRQNKLIFMYAAVPLLLKCAIIVFLSRRLTLNNG